MARKKFKEVVSLTAIALMLVSCSANGELDKRVTVLENTVGELESAACCGVCA